MIPELFRRRSLREAFRRRVPISLKLRLLFESGVAITDVPVVAGTQDGLPERVSVRPVATPAAVREAYGIHAIDRPVSGEAWDAWIAGFEPRSAPPVGTSASMIYTSGTTGKPKGVRRELDLATPTGYSVCLPDPSELPDVAVGRTAVVAPMYHSAPSVHGLWSLSQGAFVVLMPRFDPEALLRAIDEHRLNFLQLVPTMFTRMLRLPDEVDVVE